MWEKVKIPKENKFEKFSLGMRKKCKFLVDENLGYMVSEVLNDLGWNSKYVEEVGLVGRADKEVFQYAYKKKRMLLTHDEDFLDDKEFPYHSNPGVVILPGAEGSYNNFLEKAIADMITIIAPFWDIYNRAKIIFYPDREFKIISVDYEGKKITRRYKKINKEFHKFI